jgi:periplasmic divalent cation tolerance protein
MPSKPDCVELVLTCGSWQEAQRIVDRLLKKKLIACAEFLPIKSKFAWHNKLEEAEEVKLIMFSLADYFTKVEAEVKKLHSYDTFVLKAVPVGYISKAAAVWLQEVLAG